MELKGTTPPYIMTATALFTHASRIADTWTPIPETVWLPARLVSGGTYTITVKPGNTQDLGIPFRSRSPKRIFNHRRKIQLGERLVFDARFETNNVAHQISKVALRTLLARRDISTALGRAVEITVILPGGAASYIQEIYHQLGVPVIVTDSQVEARLVQVKESSITTRFSQNKIVVGAFATHALTPEILTRAPFQASRSEELPTRIFIARRGSRSLINEDEITRVLDDRGFQKFYFEEIPCELQMRLCRNARTIVAIHGAAMAHMAFNANGLSRSPGDLSGFRIVELFGPGYSVDFYRRYAAILNAHWCGVRGQITPEVVHSLDQRGLPRSHESTPFRVDPESLNMALDYSDRVSSRNAAQIKLSSVC